MRAILQRVINASVIIENKIHTNIQQGMLVFLGIELNDDFYDIDWLSNKILNLRIFNDSNKIMNLSIKEIEGEILIVSQFTLFAQTKKGNRPSYIRAAKPEIAISEYDKFINHMRKNCSLKIKSGVFGADMKIKLINDGPVTYILDSKLKEL